MSSPTRGCVGTRGRAGDGDRERAAQRGVVEQRLGAPNASGTASAGASGAPLMSAIPSLAASSYGVMPR